LDIRVLVKDSPKTDLIYWRDSYVREFESELIRIEPDGKKKAYVVLRGTVYHAKGGGQPSDTGLLTTTIGASLNIKKVMMANEVVVHYGALAEGNLDQLKPGMRISGKINWDWRYSAMRRHTAGHLLDHCLDVATGRPSKTVDSWLDEPSYVTYAGRIPSQSEIDKVLQLESEGIERGLQVKIEFVSHQEMLRIARDAPNIARLPESDLMRLVTIEGCRPIPCGGTHVKNTKEIGEFELKRVEEIDEGKAFRVYYDVK